MEKTPNNIHQRIDIGGEYIIDVEYHDNGSGYLMVKISDILGELIDQTEISNTDDENQNK